MKEEIEKLWIIEDGRFIFKIKILLWEFFVFLLIFYRIYFFISVIEDMLSVNNIICINGIDCGKKNIFLLINCIV